MPVLNGIEATKKIKAVRPETAVLILSSYDDDHYVFAILSAGAAGYLLKDVPASDVVEAVHKIHAGEAVLHPAIAKKVLHRFADGRTDDAKSAGERLETIQLTEREQQVLRLAACGRTNTEIAAELYVSVRTAQADLTQVFYKLGVSSRTEAVIAGLKQGILKLEDLDDGE